MFIGVGWGLWDAYNNNILFTFWLVSGGKRPRPHHSITPQPPVSKVKTLILLVVGPYLSWCKPRKAYKNILFSYFICINYRAYK